MPLDFQIDFDGNFATQNGDLQVEEASRRMAIDLIRTSPGAWRFAPLAGVGIVNQLESNDETDAILSRIQNQLDADGLPVRNLRVNRAPSGDTTVEFDTVVGAVSIPFIRS